MTSRQPKAALGFAGVLLLGAAPAYACASARQCGEDMPAPFEQAELEHAVRPGTCGPGDVLAQGEIVRLTNVPHTYDGGIHLGERSVAIVVVRGFTVTPGGETPGVVLAEQVLTPIRDLPVSFCLTGSLPLDSRWLEFNVAGAVYQDWGRPMVGDLLQEQGGKVDALPAVDIQLETTGLEGCAEPGSGGTCLDEC